MKMIEQMIEELNDYNEFIGTEKRYWIEGDIYFICYNVMDDMDEIEEVNEQKIINDYNKMINELPWWEKED